MKTNIRKKTLVAALLAVMMAVPMGLNAQTDGFFSNWSNGDDRDGTSSGASTTTMGQDSPDGTGLPLTDGLLILAAVGAGYTLIKRNKKAERVEK